MQIVTLLDRSLYFPCIGKGDENTYGTGLLNSLRSMMMSCSCEYGFNMYYTLFRVVDFTGKGA